MATAPGSSDLAGSAAPSPGGGVQAAAAEEEEREVVRVRVKVRLADAQPDFPGLSWKEKVVAVLGWRAGPDTWGVALGTRLEGLVMVAGIGVNWSWECGARLEGVEMKMEG